MHLGGAHGQQAAHQGETRPHNGPVLSGALQAVAIQQDDVAALLPGGCLRRMC